MSAAVILVVLPSCPAAVHATGSLTLSTLERWSHIISKYPAFESVGGAALSGLRLFDRPCSAFVFLLSCFCVAQCAGRGRHLLYTKDRHGRSVTLCCRRQTHHQWATCLSLNAAPSFFWGGIFHFGRLLNTVVLNWLSAAERSSTRLRSRCSSRQLIVFHVI